MSTSIVQNALPGDDASHDVVAPSSQRSKWFEHALESHGKSPLKSEWQSARASHALALVTSPHAGVVEHGSQNGPPCESPSATQPANAGPSPQPGHVSAMQPAIAWQSAIVSACAQSPAWSGKPPVLHPHHKKRIANARLMRARFATRAPRGARVVSPACARGPSKIRGARRIPEERVLQIAALGKEVVRPP